MDRHGYIITEVNVCVGGSLLVLYSNVVFSTTKKRRNICNILHLLYYINNKAS